MLMSRQFVSPLPVQHCCCAGREAYALEQKLGIPVLRHSEKKPAGGARGLEEHFGYDLKTATALNAGRYGMVWELSRQETTECGICRCPSSRLIMVGDRYLTDIVYGNRHGMLTIRPRPLTAEGENLSVRWVSTLVLQHSEALEARSGGAKGPGYRCHLPFAWAQSIMAAGESC